jgi:hypothetical protein
MRWMRSRARSTGSGQPASTSSCTTMFHKLLRELHAAGIRIGLVSNSHRCLASFQSHFDLQASFSHRSSSEHGMMKPHPSIFTARLVSSTCLPRKPDGRRQREARRGGGAAVGMHAALLLRSSTPHPREQNLRIRGSRSAIAARPSHARARLSVSRDVAGRVRKELAGRPGQAASADQVTMDVEHRLAASRWC